MSSSAARCDEAIMMAFTMEMVTATGIVAAVVILAALAS
jgi:hypothetical protein